MAKKGSLLDGRDMGLKEAADILTSAAIDRFIKSQDAEAAVLREYAGIIRARMNKQPKFKEPTSHA